MPTDLILRIGIGAPVEIEHSRTFLVKLPTISHHPYTNMKQLIALMAAALTTTSVYAGEFADISPKDVLTAANSKSAVIIDANSPGSYKAGHVPGALSYAAIRKDFAASLPADKNALIIAYCGNPGCGAYLQAAKAAQKLGYTNIKHMAAGIDGWNEAKMPTEPGK